MPSSTGANLKASPPDRLESLSATEQRSIKDCEILIADDRSTVVWMG